MYTCIFVIGTKIFIVQIISNNLNILQLYLISALVIHMYIYKTCFELFFNAVYFDYKEIHFIEFEVLNQKT